MQPEENNNIINQKLISCWWEYKHIKDFWFDKFMCSSMFQLQRVGERPHGSTTLPALLL